MNDAGQLEAYLQTQRHEVSADEEGKETKQLSRIHALLQEGQSYFAGKGITEPSDADLAEWKVSLRTTRSDRTASGWVREMRRYIEWQKGQSKAMNETEQTESAEASAMNESENASALSVGQLDSPTLEQVSHSESESVGDEQHDADTLEASTVEQSDTGNVFKPKRVRKDGKVQVSVYLPRATYEGIKDLAAHSGYGISDILEKLAGFFFENNAETLERIREVKQLPLKFEL